MSCTFLKNPARRKHHTRILVLSLLYAVCLLGAVYAFKMRLVTGPLAYGVGAIPALPIIGMMASIGLYLVEEDDEYLRMLMARQALWASGFALSISTIWGFLESFALVGHVAVYWVSVLWFLGLGLGDLANRLTLRRAG